MTENLLKKKNNKKGFTLIELIVVIAIIAIISLIAIPKFLGYQKDAKEKADIANAKSIANAVAAKVSDGTITLPSSETVVTSTNIEGYLQKMPSVQRDSTKFFVATVQQDGTIKVYLAATKDTHAAADTQIYP